MHRVGKITTQSFTITQSWENNNKKIKIIDPIDDYLTIFNGKALFMSLREGLSLKMWRDSVTSKLTLSLAEPTIEKLSLLKPILHFC